MFMGVARESQTDHKEPHDGREREMHVYTYTERELRVN